MTRNIVLVCLVITLVTGQDDWIFDFANQGYDFDQAIPPAGWVGINRCGEPENQSPVNLLSPLGVYGWVYGEALPFEKENLKIKYLDPKADSEIIYERKNLKLVVNQFDEGAEDKEAYYKTDFAYTLYGGQTDSFEPTSFHFHNPTEHRVDGKRSDIAIHLTHYVNAPAEEGDGLFASFSLAIWFSIDEYDRSGDQETAQIIGNFFESLKLDNRQGQSDFNLGIQEMNFQQFMHALDYDKKWIYLGAMAFPPCIKYTYWALLQRKYPLEYKYMFYIKQIFKDHYDELKSWANVRGIQQVNGH